ncbi:MAG TPA: hypothetical protein H9903_01105 [Candidatus Aquabacterium excrementipullorum]|nr:hypothetical protein [Candidatus Aquabacterium excrementipullorum]
MKKIKHPWRSAATALLAVASAGTTATAHAQEKMSYSLFGTVGAAVSNRDYAYQRHIDSNGTLERDSVLGGQVDVQFTPEWSATLQAKVAPSIKRENRWDITPSWAFVSWRPNNDWLLRAGKLRIPLYLASENLDVGQSYDFARLPTDMYSISPTSDVIGLFITRSWAVGDADLSVDAYSGQARIWNRFYTRDTGAKYDVFKTKVSGLVLTWRADETMLRLGLHHADTEPRGSTVFYETAVYNPMGPGLGYYTPSGIAPKIVNDIVTVGVDQKLPGNWRVMGELGRSFQHKTDFGQNTLGGYVAVLKNMDRWTPYVYASSLKSLGAPERLHEALTQSSVPAYIPGADIINAGQRQLADGVPFYDQHSLALGTSFALTPRSKLKAEWLRTWVDKGSIMVDSQGTGQAVHDETIDVLSLSYSFAF